MQRLVIEFSLDDVGPGTTLGGMKSFETLHVLRLEPYEFAALVRVVFASEHPRMKDLFPHSDDVIVEHELLDSEKGARTYFLRVRSRPGRHRPLMAGRHHPLTVSSISAGSYLSLPFEMRDGKLKVAFLGNAKQVRGVLSSLDRAKARYRLVSLMNARFSPNSLLGRLTERQRAVLLKGYELGYYDVPRRISSEQLAQRIGLAKSTLVEHRRKAERRLLAEVLSEV